MSSQSHDFSEISMPELAAMVAEHLQKHDIQVVLVGGLAIDIYTDNLYLTQDIDMVNINYQSAQKINEAMAGLGFIKQGRVYVNETTPVVVEFPSGPLSVGDELIQNTTYAHVGHRTLAVLKVEDAIKDRLAAFIHWGDNPSLVQAVAVMVKHNISSDTFKQFCIKEGSSKQYQLLDDFYKQASQRPLTTMSDLEPILTRLLIKNL